MNFFFTSTNSEISSSLKILLLPMLINILILNPLRIICPFFNLLILAQNNNFFLFMFLELFFFKYFDKYWFSNSISRLVYLNNLFQDVL